MIELVISTTVLGTWDYHGPPVLFSHEAVSGKYFTYDSTNSSFFICKDKGSHWGLTNFDVWQPVVVTCAENRYF